MYEEYYGFAQSPFTLAPDPRFLYRSVAHEDAINSLVQAIHRKEGFIVLTGDIGTGKTTMCRTLLEQLEPTTFTSLILNPFLSVEELLREVLLDFGVVSRDAVRGGRIASASRHELVSTLHDFLRTLVPIHGTAVIIIDEAQHLSPQLLEQIRLISNLETNEAKLLQILLVGQLDLLEVLSAAEIRQLDQRISLRAMLKPLDRGEIDAYVERRLTVANGATSVTFSSSAMDLVFAATGGVPRVINLLCDRALMSGARKQVTEITPAIVKEAANSLLLTAPESGVARFLKPRWLALLGALLVLAVVAALVPADWFTDMTLPRLPGTPPKPVAAAATALAPPTADLLLPPPILPPPTPRRVPRPDTDAAPPVSP